MGSLLSSPSKPKVVAPPEVPEGPTEEERKAAIEAEKKRQRMARGRRSTMLTGGLGVQGEAPGQRKVLLGQ
jgi:hypothetical protein